MPHQNVALPEGEWPRVAFVDVPTLPCTLSAINLPEAQVIARLVLDLYRRHSLSPPSEGDEGLCLGIIVPYRAQISAVRQAIDTLLPQNSDTITIDTVERFQGSQRDIIIYGFTVSHPSQFDFLTQLSFEEDGHIIDRKLNVAMTRAREHLILVGNASLLRQNPLYAQLIDTIGVTPDTELHVPSEIR